jgi:hypothetical protein
MTPLPPLPIPDRPNLRIHADLFSPMLTVDSNKKFVLCITDAFTKYAVVFNVSKNPKLAPTFTGPGEIIDINDTNAKVKLNNNIKILNVNKLKLFLQENESDQEQTFL